MKFSILAGCCTLFTLSSHASLMWTGAGDQISLYLESNWQEDDGSALEANEIDPGVLVSADTGGEIRIESGLGQPSNYGGGDFVIGSNHLIVSGKTLRSVTQGISASSGALTVNAGATVNVTTLTGFNGGAGISINGGTLTAGGEINVNGTSFDVANGGSVTAGAIRILGGGSEWAGGNITLSDPNPFRTGGAVSLSNSFNVTAAPGTFSLTHTDLSAGYTNRDIAGKLLIGFFSLDGTHIDPDDNGFAGGLNNEADVVALNNFLRTNYTINGKYLELSDNTGDMRTLSVVAAIPEPATLSLLALSSLALLVRRRR